jgi:hypothetical protein
VFRLRVTWLVTVMTTALLAVMLLSVSTGEAKTPGWGFSAVTVNPAPVGLGKLAQYSFTISNTGRSNISALILKTDIAAGPLATPAWIQKVDFIGQPDLVAPCGANPPTGPLNCNLGALNAGNSIDFQIIFRVPASGGTYAFNFMATGNGNTASDSGGTSHGDTLKGPASVSVSGNAEFDGGFTLGDGGTFGTNGTLGKNNPQNSSVVTTQAFAATTIQDSATYTGGTDPCGSLNCIGQWSKVSAPNPDNGPIKVVLLVYGKGLPGNVGPEDITLLHLDNGGFDDGIIGDSPSERCASATDSASAPCIFVEAVGQNFRITAWLLHNGSLRGHF